jgi:hypothetical protein
MLAAALLLAVVGLAGCASKEDATDDPTGPTETPTSTTPSTSTSATSEPTDDGQVIEITIKGDTVSPNGKKVDVQAGEPVILDLTSDAPGELHLHSTPEQEIEFDAGESTHTVTFDRPGVVVVESHQLEKVIVQLQVR